VKSVETRYAKSGELRIAYQVVGQGSFDLVFVPGFISNLELHWEEPGYSRLLRRLSAFSRLIQFDKRGTGLSDRADAHALPDLKTRMDDVRAVMDAAGSGRAVLLGASEGAPMSILFAATYPGRTRGLVLYGAYADFHTWVMGQDRLDDFIAGIERGWGSGAALKHFAPGRVDDPHFRDWWARFERLSATPTTAMALARMNADIDVRDVLEKVRTPTLVIHRKDDARVDPAAGRYLASKIKDARLVELPGRDHPIWTGDVERVADTIEEFLTGARASAGGDRVLAALLVARIVRAKGFADGPGDREASELAEQFRHRAEALIVPDGGRLCSWDGEKLVFRLDGSTKAAHAALALRRAAGAAGLKLAQAIHAGEVETRGDTVAGVALRVAEQVAARSGPGQIVASSIVVDLSAGSGLHFQQAGSLVVDGASHPIGLVELATEQHLEPVVRSRKAPDLDLLSQREREVLELIADGMSNPAIAGRLQLSEHTVKRHVANILMKLDLPTRTAAATLAARHPRL
jgi:pimeloyl-ACP methyl ester carboxylesterase/DNA-binding CsgD family transcriptional regulator